ncbi:MAG: DUF2333 family protein [Thermodesulfobacteriota bacterium]
MNPDKLPVPLPPEPESPKGFKALWQHHRFILAILVVLVFFGLIFGLGWYRQPQTAGTPDAPDRLAATTPPAKASVPLEPSPLKSPATLAPETGQTKAPGSIDSQVPELTPPPKSEGSAPEAPAAPGKPGAPGHAAPEPAPPALPAPAPPAPAPAPQPPTPAEKVRGVIFTEALIKIIDDQVNQPLFGWRPNTIVFGKMGLTDNVNHLQLGVLEVARRTVLVLNENMTRFAVTEAYNPEVNEARNYLMVSPEKYWFPSASGKYREAMQYLGIYIEDLQKGRSRFYTRVDNLIALFSNYKDILGSCYYNLLKDTEPDGSDVSWFKTDDYFYFSQGVALSMATMLEAVQEDFHPELQKKNTHKLLEDTIHALHVAAHLNPWLITNGDKDGILANHRANLSTYIGEAEHLMATMQTVLATN